MASISGPSLLAPVVFSGLLDAMLRRPRLGGPFSRTLFGDHPDPSVVELARRVKAASPRDTKTGAPSEAQRHGRAAFFDRARATAEVVRLNESVALWAAELWADLEQRGAMIPALHLLIAATELARGWPLANADIKDFRRIDGLELVELRAG